MGDVPPLSFYRWGCEGGLDPLAVDMLKNCKFKKNFRKRKNKFGILENMLYLCSIIIIYQLGDLKIMKNNNMKSTIRVDFAGQDNADGFQPVIRINLQDSEDVRDGLLKRFFQSLGGESNWLTVNFHQDTIDGLQQPKRITIYPVKESELQETTEIIENRLGKKPAPEFFSRFGIGQEVAYTTLKEKDYAFEQAKKASPDTSDDELSYIPKYFYGKITAVKFTEAKVWYSILDNYSGKVVDDIPSHDVKIFSEETIKELKNN